MRILHFLDKNLEAVISAFLLSLIVILLSIQVFYRFFLGGALAWQEEIVRFAFVWFIYFGMSLGAQHGEHIRVTSLIELFKGPWRRLAFMLADGMWILFNICAVIISLEMIGTFRQFKQTSPVLGWEMPYIYLIIPCSLILTTFRIIQRNIRYSSTEKLQRS